MKVEAAVFWWRQEADKKQEINFAWPNHNHKCHASKTCTLEIALSIIQAL